MASWRTGQGAWLTTSKSINSTEWAFFAPTPRRSSSQSLESPQLGRSTSVRDMDTGGREISIRADILPAVNYRLKQEDIAYIFDHGEVEVIIADEEYVPLLEIYRSQHPETLIIIDTDTDATEGELTGPFDKAVLEGLKEDLETGSQGWQGLESQAADENAILALSYTSGTTARPKGVEFTHRGCYLGTMGNIIESGLNYHGGRARYLWTLPMFHAMGTCTLPT